MWCNYQTVYEMAPFPLPQLAEMREKYTFNITPFSAALSASSGGGKQRKAVVMDTNDDDDDNGAEGINCFAVIMPSQPAIMAKAKVTGKLAYL